MIHNLGLAAEIQRMLGQWRVTNCPPVFRRGSRRSYQPERGHPSDADGGDGLGPFGTSARHHRNSRACLGRENRFLFNPGSLSDFVRQGNSFSEHTPPSKPVRTAARARTLKGTSISRPPCDNSVTHSCGEFWRQESAHADSLLNKL